MSGASPATEPAGRTFWDRASQYAFAIAAVAAACGVKLIVGHWLADADSLFLAAVSITAWRAGVAPGLLAVILSSLSQAYFFLAPYYSISIASAEEAVQLGLWSAEAALLCFLFGALRAARSRALHSASDAEAKQNLLVQSEDRLRSAHDALERRVEERTSELASANANLVREADERDRVQRELERSEGQFRQLQKMEAVSRLAGGVAHDFNNLLSVILSYGEMALSDLKPGEPPSEELTEIVKAGKRAADLTRQLLLFSRQQVVAPKILHLGEVLLGMEKMLRRLVGEDVELTCKGTASLRRVEADPGSIEQVIMNLVVNARDAMPTGGKLTIETSDVVLDEAFARQHVGVEPGPYVMLAVSDTGVGMGKETQGRIFEPFFTTKEMGKGTGLGLSTVFGIVRQSGGTVWVYSEPGKGSTFKVYLPTIEAATDSLQPSVSPATLRGSETILLVEDEEQVRAVARQILRRLGYQVIEASGPEEALRLCRSHVGRIHLLLTDVVMPEMSGPELAGRLTKQRPEMKVLCMSGYTDDAVVRHGVLGSGVPYLQKPLTPEALGLKVREAIEAPRLALPP